MDQGVAKQAADLSVASHAARSAIRNGVYEHSGQRWRPWMLLMVVVEADDREIVWAR